MDTYETNNDISYKEKNKIAKVAGLMFLCSLIIPSLNWALILSKFIVPENVISTADNIMANIIIFRIGIINEVLSSIVIILLSISLYLILKSFNKNLALIALILKLADAFITLVIAIAHLASLQFLSNLSSLTTTNQEQVKSLVGIFLNMNVSLTSIPGMLLGLSMSIFLYLLLKSKYIPIMISSFGLISYILLFVYDLLFFLSPAFSSIIIVQIVGWGPYVLLLPIIGFWLLIKGLNINNV